MASFLLKTEPGEYSFDDLLRDRACVWEGVSSAPAQKWMRTMRKGDQAFIYHTGDERRISGLARITRGAYPDPSNPELTSSGEPRFVLVDLAPVRAASAACTLGDIKADERFAGFALVRQPRLSVMPVPEELDALLRTMIGV